ncbi:hypothetical protein DH86_00003147 [Scytalidium sp. 3C]|nr:hypothetical protein DH86_00003147 [Scytalidium sp. 3C]
MEGTGRSKAGYQKIIFCEKQARTDGLRFFWVDTCCIDKSSSAELTEAINSMFRWYRNASKCYVYLSDISFKSSRDSDDYPPRSWEPDFRKSRWFTRGWTLQELVAPASVEFYSAEGERLGDRKSLEQQIHEITGISHGALQGDPLSRFSIDERMSWAKNRKTKREEDGAYALLGIFNIHLPLIYGEGRERAMFRLYKEIKESPEGGSSTPFPVHRDTPKRRKDDLPKRCHHIPFVRNKRFVGRKEILDELERKFFIEKNCQQAAIVGLGGIGKTQVALQFAYWVKENRPEYSIFWIPAISKAAYE